MNIWVIALMSAAGLGLAAEDAFADRPRHNSSSSSSSTHRHSSSAPQHRHHHHVEPHRHHHHHYSPPRRYYYAAPIYIAPSPFYVAPPIIAASPPVVPGLNTGYWYFCPSSQVYYPHVLECAAGWLAVVPGAPGPN